MEIEFRNLKREAAGNLAKEKQWVGNLNVAYKKIQNVISLEFKKTIPTNEFPKPAPLIVIPDSEFTNFTREGTKKDKNENIFHAMYTPYFSVIILPEHTAKMFQGGGMKSAAATCMLAEEYLHHVTTIISEEGNLKRVGFYDLGGVKRTENKYENGAVYVGNLDISSGHGEQELLIPTSSSGIVLTENSTRFVVNSLARELNGAILNNHKVLSLFTENTNGNIHDDSIHLSRKVSEKVFKAMITGDPGFLEMKAPSAKPQKPAVDIKYWLSQSNLNILLFDPEFRTKNNRIDVFSYQDNMHYL